MTTTDRKTESGGLRAEFRAETKAQFAVIRSMPSAVLLVLLAILWRTW